MQALLLSSLLACAAPFQADESRPGLVFVPGGSTAVGAEVEATIERIREHQADANFLAGETPRHMVGVPPFYISPTPVTNEMYLAFVMDTGAVPPSIWADISKELRAELIIQGKEAEGPAYKFDEAAQDRWWKENWQDEAYTWSLPAELALEPVVFLTYADVLAYCDWAGLRPPTEAEWVRAARGDGTADFPWGDEADNTKAAFNATMPRALASKRLPVGSLPNASVYGVYDMTGQVYEFTSTPGKLYDEYKSFEVELLDEKGKVESKLVPSPNDDYAYVIVKGGSFLNPLTNCRIDARIPLNPEWAAPALGFRVASSANPYADVVAMRTRGMRSRVLGGSADNMLALNESVGVMKREMPDMDAIEAKRKPHPEYEDAPAPPEGYAVFGRASSIVVAPALDPFGGDYKRAAMASVEPKLRKAVDFPVVGMIVTTVDLAEPALPAGNYALRYMPGMKKRELEAIGAWVAGEERPAEDLELDTPPPVPLGGLEFTPGTQPNLLVVNDEGEAVAILKVKGGKVFSRKAEDIEHGVTFDEEAKKLNVQLRLPGARGKAYGLGFTLNPVDAEGNSLTRPADWGIQVQGR